ncbi:hypothetical protein E2C01_025885 [Portunus trituberculatus]|uniref:Uncharacterized protein n=1 Tax=Portunus trituberculatus TaxID=210409 RepID=A0A5B7EE46_PORTR|nr:hypothetical protein [Portunus trituberculatus]
MPLLTASANRRLSLVANDPNFPRGGCSKEIIGMREDEELNFGTPLRDKIDPWGPSYHIILFLAP